MLYGFVCLDLCALVFELILELIVLEMSLRQIKYQIDSSFGRQFSDEFIFSVLDDLAQRGLIQQKLTPFQEISYVIIDHYFQHQLD